jgi:hypothetical protein
MTAIGRGLNQWPLLELLDAEGEMLWCSEESLLSVYGEAAVDVGAI